MNENISPAVMRRIMKEVSDLARNSPEGVKIIPIEDDLSEVQAIINGPEGTPFENGSFRIKLRFGAEFPQAPPKGFFITKIFHPNVSNAGEICINTLKKDWKEELGLRHVLVTVKCLLIHPNPESALNEEAGRLLLEDYEDYAARARLMTTIHAKKEVIEEATEVESDSTTPVIARRPAKTITKKAASSAMERFLEAVADCVSQLVLFSVESNEKEEGFQGGKIVEQSSNALKRTVKRLEILNTPQIKDKLGDVGSDLGDGVTEIVENALLLAKDLSNAIAKQGVLHGSKKLLQNLVNGLQLTDISQCATLIKKSQKIVSLLEDLRTCSIETKSQSHFADICPEIVLQCIALVTISNERSKLIPKYSVMLLETQTNIANELQQLITTSKDCLENDEGDEQLENKRQGHEQVMLHALDEMCLIAKESSAGIFDNLSVDLDLVTVMDSSAAEDGGIYDSIRKLQDTLHKLVEFTKKGDKQNSIDQLKAIRALLAPLTSHITNCLTSNDLVALTKACLLNPTDEKTFANLTSSVDRLQSALTILKERTNLPTSLTGELRDIISNMIEQCEITFETLAQSVFLSDQPTAIQHAKKALNLLNSASELAAGLADRMEDEALTAYFMATNRAIKATMPPLLTSTKAALLDTANRPEFIRAKDFALYAAFALSPPKNVVSPENQLLDQITHIQEHLCLLRNSVVHESDINTQACLKGVLEAAKEGVRAIQAYIPFASNPADLENLCFELINEKLKYLGHVMVASGTEAEKTASIESTSIANAHILTLVLTNHKERLEENTVSLEPLFKSLMEPGSEGSEDVAVAHTKLSDLILEQIVVSLSLADNMAQQNIQNHFREIAMELIVRLGLFFEHFSPLLDDPSLDVLNDKVKENVKALAGLTKQLVEQTPMEKGDPQAPKLEESRQLLARIETLTIDDSAIGKLYAASKVIALDLSGLVEGSLSKAESIKCARKICNQAHIIVKQVQAFIKLCKDKRLSSQLEVGAMSARTKCVQLKILCAVKAASSIGNAPADSDSEDQLIGCVLGLTKDLHTTISAAEVASIAGFN